MSAQATPASSQSDTPARLHRITRPTLPPKRTLEEVRAAATEHQAETASQIRETGQQIGCLLPAVAGAPPSASGQSPRTGGPPVPEKPMPTGTDASTSMLPSPTTGTNPEPAACTTSTLTPDGAPGARSPACTTPQGSSPQTAVAAPRMFTAREIQEAIRNNPLEAASLTDSLPPALKLALRGNRRGRMTSEPAPGQLEIPSLSSDFWCVRLRQPAYMVLKAFVDAQGRLAELGPETRRQAVIAKVRAAAIERQRDPDAGQQVVADAQAEVWWAALGQYPPWAIYAAGMQANAENKFAPRPAEVAEIARRLFDPVRIQLQHAAYAVADIERLRPEWCA